MHISNDIRYIGVNDHQIDLFEGQYIVPNGMAYNSYVIMDEKIAVLDTVDQLSVSAVRFRLLELRTVLTVYHCLLDCQDITVKTIPCQTSDLRCTEAEPDSQKERQFKVCALAECYRVIDQNIRLLPAKLLSQLT